MSDLKRRKINHDEKKRMQTYLYHRQSNCSIKNLTRPTGDRYLIQLITFADPKKSLADIFLYFSHSIFEIEPKQTNFDFKTVEFNRLFIFMVKLFLLHERYLPQWIKKTQQIDESVRDIIGETFVGKEEGTKKLIQRRIEQLYEKSQVKVNKQLKAMKSKLQVSYQKVSDFELVRAVKLKFLQHYYDQILAIKDLNIRKIYISDQLQDIASEYLRKLLNTLVNVQFSRKSYRYFKMMDFMKSYKDYLYTDYIESDRRDTDRFLLVKRYSSIKNMNGSRSQILMNLYQMVELRKEGDYFDLDIQIIKKLGKQLWQHKKSTQKSYPLLHPKYVIFDQLKLEVYLSYQAPLLAALGLLKMPCSLEQSVAFSATPQLFDIFSSPEQHLRSSLEEKVGTGQQIFYDALYSMDSLVDQYDPRYKYQKLSKPFKNTKIFMKDVKTERDKISQAWRFVMIASFLLNGREYFKIKTEPLFDYTRFKQFLKEQRKECEIQTPKKYVAKVMGSRFVEQINKAKIQLDDSEDMSLAIFNTFLGVNDEGSQISLQSRFYKANLLIRYKRMLKKDFMELLQNNKQLNTMTSVTRYLVAFYFLLFEICSYIQMVAEYYAQNFSKGRELVKVVGKKINIDEIEESEDQDTTLNKAYRKLKQYDNKRSENIKYLRKYYQTAYLSLDSNKSSVLQLRKRFKQTIFSQQSEETKSNINEILSENAILMVKLQRILIDAIQREFSHQKDKMFMQQPRKVLFIYSIHVKIRLFLLFNHDNYATLDSLVSPFITLQKEGEEPARVTQMYEYGLQILKEHEAEMHKMGQI